MFLVVFLYISKKRDMDKQQAKKDRNEIALIIAPVIITELYKDDCYADTTELVEDIYHIADMMYKQSLKEI